jgi:hypothetical protein
MVKCTAGLKPSDSYQESTVSLNILTVFSLYMYKTILFENENDNCMTYYKFHAHNRTSFISIAFPAPSILLVQTQYLFSS